MTTAAEIKKRNQQDRARRNLAVKAIAAPQSEDHSQSHTVTASASPIDKLLQLQEKHKEQREKEWMMCGLAEKLETVAELKIFLEAVMAEEVDTARVCEHVPCGGFRGDKPDLRRELPAWLQDAINARILARLGR